MEEVDDDFDNPVPAIVEDIARELKRKIENPLT